MIDQDIQRPGSLERALIDHFQHDLPLTPRPFAAIAVDLGCSEADVLAALRRLHEAGVLSRVGAVITPHSIGWSTLAAIAVEDSRLEKVAELVGNYAEVNHSYARDHPVNLWFVVTAPTAARGVQILDEIAERTGLNILNLPLEQAYHIDLGFAKSWT